MSKSIATKRYAEALFQLGHEQNLLDEIVADLKIVTKVFKDNERIYTFLKHPRIKYAEKKQFLTETFRDLQTTVLHTMQILVERGRPEFIPGITDQLIQMVNNAKGIAVAQVYSVRKLSETEEQSLAANFAKRFNKREINIKNIVDSSLLGGLKIRVGNTVFDGSIKGKLDRLERNIVTANK